MSFEIGVSKVVGALVGFVGRCRKHEGNNFGHLVCSEAPRLCLSCALRGEL